MRQQPLPKSAFPYFREVQTRWMDNDMYGHVNNAVYYSYFDTVINNYLREAKLIDAANGHLVGLAVETGCSYFSEISYPDIIHAGLRVGHLGRTSVRYEVGLFRGGAPLTAAFGRFTHAYVDRTTRKTLELPAGMRDELRKLVVE
jgi:acyl-CoA thioester hydrolase